MGDNFIHTELKVPLTIYKLKVLFLPKCLNFTEGEESTIKKRYRKLERNKTAGYKK
jgi:hypothetical protein